MGPRHDLVDVPARVVVGVDGPGDVLLGTGGGEVLGGGEDRVARVIRVGHAVAVDGDAVLGPGGGLELHPADRAGGRGVEVLAVVGLDGVDRGQHLPRDVVLAAGLHVDGDEERRRPVAVGEQAREVVDRAGERRVGVDGAGPALGDRHAGRAGGEGGHRVRGRRGGRGGRRGLGGGCGGLGRPGRRRWRESASRGGGSPVCLACLVCWRACGLLGLVVGRGGGALGRRVPKLSVPEAGVPVFGAPVLAVVVLAVVVLVVPVECVVPAVLGGTPTVIVAPFGLVPVSPVAVGWSPAGAGQLRPQRRRGLSEGRRGVGDGAVAGGGGARRGGVGRGRRCCGSAVRGMATRWVVVL